MTQTAPWGPPADQVDASLDRQSHIEGRDEQIADAVLLRWWGVDSN